MESSMLDVIVPDPDSDTFSIKHIAVTKKATCFHNGW